MGVWDAGCDGIAKRRKERARTRFCRIARDDTTIAKPRSKPTINIAWTMTITTTSIIVAERTPRPWSIQESYCWSRLWCHGNCRSCCNSNNIKSTSALYMASPLLDCRFGVLPMFIGTRIRVAVVFERRDGIDIFSTLEEMKHTILYLRMHHSIQEKMIVVLISINLEDKADSKGGRMMRTYFYCFISF